MTGKAEVYKHFKALYESGNETIFGIVVDAHGCNEIPEVCTDCWKFASGDSCNPGFGNICDGKERTMTEGTIEDVVIAAITLRAVLTVKLKANFAERKQLRDESDALYRDKGETDWVLPIMEKLGLEDGDSI